MTDPLPAAALPHSGEGLPADRRSGRARGLWLNLLVSLGSIAFVVLTFAGTEAVLRLADPGYLSRVFGEEGSTVYSETYGWDLRKGFRGVSFGTLQTINRLGYRGTEHPMERVPGHTRVLMLGDSIAYGAGVADDQTFSALLEARNPTLEIVNMSVGGYGTDQELLKLEMEGVRYHPDLVILHFCLFSDFFDNDLHSSLWDSRQPKPYFTWDGKALVEHDDHVRLSLPREGTQWLADESHVYNRLRQLLGVRQPPREQGKAHARIAAVKKDFSGTVDLTLRLIRRIRDVAEASGARFVVVIHPDRDDFTHPTRFLTAFCNAPLLDGISVVDMSARYHALGMGFGVISLDTVGHLRRPAHKVVADVVERLIEGPAPKEWEYSTTCGASPAS